MILNYDDVKEKPNTLRAMTSLNRNEFEKLCESFGEVWDEKTKEMKKDPNQGGRKPILKSPEDRLFLSSFTSRLIRCKRC